MDAINEAHSREDELALVCSIGGKPQVATFALDALLRQGARVNRLLAVHLSTEDARVKRSVEALRTELATHSPYVQRGIGFESVTIRPVRQITDAGHPVYGTPVARIDEQVAPDAIWMTFNGLIARLKTEGVGVALCVTGGPRLIGLQALSAASVMFSLGDRCWHLFTPDDIRERAGEGALLHVPLEEAARVRVVEVPTLPLGAWAPAYRYMAFARPRDVVAASVQRLSDQEVARCREVLSELTARQREVLRAFAAGASSVSAVAKQLHISPATVDSHKRVIFAACRAVWGLPANEPRHFSFLREHFGRLPDHVWAG